MRNIGDIEIKKAVVHVLDNNSDKAILSSAELELDTNVIEYIDICVSKQLADGSSRAAAFYDEDTLVNKSVCAIAKNNNIFLYASYDIAKKLFEVVNVSFHHFLKSKRMYFEHKRI